MRRKRRGHEKSLTWSHKGYTGPYLTAGRDDPRERYKWVTEDGIFAEVKSLHRQDRMECNHNSEGGVDCCREEIYFFSIVTEPLIMC